MKYSKKDVSLIIIIFCFFTILAINIDPKIKDIDGGMFAQFFSSVKSYNIFNIFLFPMLYVFFASALSKAKSDAQFLNKLCIAVPAALFAFFMVFGSSFENYNNWQQVMRGGVQLLKSIIIFVGYYFLFAAGIVHLFCFLNTKNLNSAPLTSFPLNRYYSMLDKRPFLGGLISLIILYLPVVLASMPVLFTGDSDTQIAQGFNLPSGTSNYLNLISEDVLLNNHHPITHTLFMNICLRIGHFIFDSYNAGLYIYGFSQFLTCVLVYSFVIAYLIRQGVCKHVIALIILYLGLSPRIQNYLFLFTKDVFFTACLLLFVYFYTKTLSSKLNSGERIVFFLSALGVMLFRNDGFYILFASLIFSVILLKDKRKHFLPVTVFCLLFFSMFNGVFLPAMKITSSSRREMLSVPFQQTARYLRDAGNDVTKEEKAAISAVLDYDKIAAKYDPNKSDNVKATFNESADSEDMKNYFKAWFSMFLKHPGIYIQATMNNYYQYFYPGGTLKNTYSYAWSSNRMEVANERREDTLNPNFHYPEVFSEYRTGYERFRENIFKLPPLSILICPATYSWVLITAFFYTIYRKSKKATCSLLSLCFVLLICLLGPCNGSYGRYIYPIIVVLPFTCIQMLLLVKETENQGGIQNG